MAKYIYGVDFGTTNSALAILDIDTNELVKLFTMPSVLFFPELASGFSYFTGDEAMERYVAGKSSSRLLKSIKTVLPVKSFTHTVISRKPLNTEDLVSMVIKALKKEADAYLGEIIKTAVIGRQFVFSEEADKEATAQSRLKKTISQPWLNPKFSIEFVMRSINSIKSEPEWNSRNGVLGVKNLERK